jgi:hypothetical protein
LPLKEIFKIFAEILLYGYQWLPKISAVSSGFKFTSVPFVLIEIGVNPF